MAVTPNDQHDGRQPDDAQADERDLARLLAYADKQEIFYREDVAQLDSYIMKVAGLGATVGGYLLASGTVVNSELAQWVLVGAVICCITAGIATGVGLALARRRGENVISSIDQLHIDAFSDQTVDLHARRDAIEESRSKHERPVEWLNRIGGGLALLGVCAYIVAAVAAAAVPAEKPEDDSPLVTIDGDSNIVTIYNAIPSNEP
jgi:hypothetical protein